MITAAVDSWTRNWTIVSADLDLAHVMLPLINFKLQSVNPAGTSYQVLHDQAPALDCFADSVLAPAGDQRPSFFDITGKEELPLYSQATVGDYVDVLELMGAYMMQNPGVQRLQGVIKIPCHAHGAKSPQGAQFPPGARPGHAPSTIETTVHLYQFDGVVTGGPSLLVVRAPLSPVCPKNGDGTAIGYSK